MGKRTGGLLCVLLLALLPAGCQFIRIEEGERTPDRSSEILSFSSVPSVLKSLPEFPPALRSYIPEVYVRPPQS